MWREDHKALSHLGGERCNNKWDSEWRYNQGWWTSSYHDYEGINSWRRRSLIKSEEEEHLKWEIEHSEIVTDGIHGVVDASSKDIEDYLQEKIVDGYHSLGVITKSYLEVVTLCKEEPWAFLTMFEEMVASKSTLDPTHQGIIGGDDFIFFVLLTNDIDDCLLSRCLKDNFMSIMNE